MLAEGFVVHEQVHHLAAASSQPAGKFLGREGMLGPRGIRHPEAEIVREHGISKQGLDPAARRRAVNEVRRLAFQIPLYALGEDAVEAQVFHFGRECVMVNQLGVAKDPRADTKDLLQLLLMQCHLALELLFRVNERERVMVGLG